LFRYALNLCIPRGKCVRLKEIKVEFSREETFDTLEKIEGVSLLVVGDLILDRYIWGTVNRISPEAPVPVVEVKQIEDRLGGAGNVVRNLRKLGAQVNVCGFVGDDEEGDILLRLLQEEGATQDLILRSRGRPTPLKSRVIAHSQQIVRIDREEHKLGETPLRKGLAALVDSQIDQYDAVIVSDYGKGAVSPELMEMFQSAHQKGRLSLDKRALFFDPHPNNYPYYPGVGISVAKPNRKEAEQATGIKITDPKSAADAARSLIKLWGLEMIMITLGEDGLIIMEEKEDKPIYLDTAAITVFDVSGAGDTVTALFASALAVGASPGLAGFLSNIGAGIVVSEVGTAPINRERLRRTLEGQFLL
jgi:rfaE bifunctional protein kinase chain/domain